MKLRRHTLIETGCKVMGGMLVMAGLSVLISGHASPYAYAVTLFTLAVFAFNMKVGDA